MKFREVHTLRLWEWKVSLILLPGLTPACRKRSLANMKTLKGEGLEARHQQHLLWMSLQSE